MTEITIVGNLTDDPELRFTGSSQAVAKFTVAVNRQTYDRQANAWKDAGTSFYRCTAFGQLAENIAESLARGSRAVVLGDHREDHWLDKDTQEKKSGWSVIARAVGAELTFATAKVTKTTSNRADATPPDDPWATASKQRPAPATAAAGAWPQGSGPRGPQGGYSDQPPF
jgi:single-strand DNA-binding protein